MRFFRDRRATALVGVAVAAAVLLAGGAAANVLPWQAGPGAPENDAFIDALAVDDRFVGTTAGAQADPEEVAAGVASEGQRVVWFLWTAPVSGWAYVTPATAGAPEIPEVRAYLGDAIDVLQRVDLAPDVAGAGASIPASAGFTYKVAVIGAGAGASFDLAITQPLQGVKINDEPSGAIDVGATVEEASTSGSPEIVAVETLGGATAAANEPAHGGSPAEHSVWYSWTAARGGGSVTFSALPVYGSTGPFRVAVHRAEEADDAPGLSVLDLQPVPGGAAGGPIEPVAGTTYLIAVDGVEQFVRLQVTSSGVASSADAAPPTISCDDAPAGWTSAEEVTVACTAVDDGSGLALPDDASFTLVARTTDGVEDDALVTDERPVCDVAGNCATAGPVGPIRADRKPPSVTCSPLDESWTAALPSVTCTATDDGSGLADDADASRTFEPGDAPAGEGPVTIDGAEVCDAAGNCTTVGPFGPANVDRQAPAIECDDAPTTAATDEVRITCRATDGGSGLADATDAEFELTTSVGPGAADDDAATDEREVCDLVGNCAAAGPVTGLVVDRAPPSVTCTPDDGAPVDDWRAGPFDFTCEIADLGTGLAPGTPATVALLATLPDGEASDDVSATSVGPTEVCDLAGNCSSVGPVRGLRIDRQAPTATCPPPGTGWADGEATVTCPVSDGDGSGIDGADAVVLRAVAPAEQEGTFDTDAVEVCDEVGRCTTVGPVRGLRIDARAPQVRCAEPAAEYRVEARIACTASDGGSGLADPADESFVLVTSVGDGNADSAAQTDARTVCDVAGRCATAGPLTVSVDRTGGTDDGPELRLPQRMTVLSTFDPLGPTQVLFDLPEVLGADEVACRPRPGTTFVLGWTTVICEAVGPLGTTLGTFPLVVKGLPELAPDAAAAQGGGWRAVGVGFAPGSAVEVRIGTRRVATATAGPDGRVAAPFDVPDDLPSGSHLLSVVGRDAAGEPHLVVGPLDAVATPPGGEPPADPPPGAPALPPTGPAVPVDPGPPPAAPDLGQIPPATTTTTVPDDGTTTTTLPGATTVPGDPGDPGGGGADGGSADGTDDGGFGPLPRTGAQIAGLVAIALALLGSGWALLANRARLRRGDRAA